MSFYHHTRGFPRHYDFAEGTWDTFFECFMRGEVMTYNTNTKEWKLFAEGLLLPLGIHAVSDSEVLVMQTPNLMRIKDTDGDGKFDKATVFADQLAWPTSVCCYKGGVFVAAAPDIWYFKDTDGDLRADARRKVFTGFGTQNQQGMLNNLVFGLDHKVYGATSVNGGTVRPAGATRERVPRAPAVRVDGKDFRFDPVTLRFETVTGTVQFGNTFDDWGQRFVCDNRHHLRHIVLENRYVERNPNLAAPPLVHDISVLEDGPLSFRVRLSGLLSLMIWTSAVIAGRWIGFLLE